MCCAACCVLCNVPCCAVQELGRSPFPVVRNNIMVALSDMLIQYTALVDAHMPRLAGCIRYTVCWGAAMSFLQKCVGPCVKKSA